MPRFPTPDKPAPQESRDGDAAFVGMNMKLDPALLPPGFYAEARNKRCNKGKLEPRRGTIMPAWANFGLSGQLFQGSGVYSNPNGEELLLIASGHQAFALQEGTAPAIIPYQGFGASKPTELTQHFNIVLLQQDGLKPTFWNGDPTVPFRFVTKSNPADTSTKVIPPIPWSVNFGNRNIFPSYSASVFDTVIASLILDYTTYDPVNAVFRINTGTSDNIVGFIPYANSNLIVAKQRSMDILINFLGDLSLASMQVLNSEIGLAARKAAVMVGNDVHFLAPKTGIHAINQIIQGRIFTSPVPLSDPIQPLIDRINWNAVGGSVAASIAPYDFFAVPIDNSTVNNAIIVLNNQTQNFEGYDTWDGPISIDALHVFTYKGQKRLFAVDYKNTAVYLMYEGNTDILTDGEHEIVDMVKTRAYSQANWNPGSQRDFKRVRFETNTLRPSITVTQITENAGDARILNSTPITRDPVEYITFAKKDYDITNVNNDFLEPGREDYSVSTVQANGGVFLQDGISFEQLTSFPLKFATQARGRNMQYRIDNTQGQCELLSTEVKSSVKDRQIGRTG